MPRDKIMDKIQQAINEWLSSGDNELLLEELPSLVELWNELSFKEGDFRTGVETYGYGQDELKDNMEYIADRWKCAFRVKWIIDGLENGSM